ncbi:MAG: tetratricopeptide repeat protein [Rhodospirillales bacterium]|nr:tetratricopeptide repeat protein [Rhodospirillales bacterium]
MLILTVVMFAVWTGITWYNSSVPGDFEVRQGDIKLSDGLFANAIERFDAALEAAPDHRGALLGKAAALMGLEHYDEAEGVLTHAIDFLLATLVEDDPTGTGALSAAYANRGILRDRQGRYEEALADYVEAVKIDYDLADGPGWVDHLLYYDKKPSSVLTRARYIYEQLQLPEGERLMRVPEQDDLQRMYKP